MKTTRIAALLLRATALFGLYQYSQSDTFSTVDPDKWWQVGTPVTSGQGLSSDGTSQPALVSKLAVPSGGTDYEVKTTITFGDNSQGDMLARTYLRVTGGMPYVSNASYYLLETDVSSSNGSCSYSLYKHYVDGSTPVNYLLGQGGGSCHNGSTIRTMIRSWSGVDAYFEVYIDDVGVGSIIDAAGFPQTSGYPSGQPGVGVITGCASGCGAISRVDIGPMEHVGPNPVSAGSIGKSVWANRMDVQWQAATDDANGIGVAVYVLTKNGTIIIAQTALSYSDQTLIPGVTYAYVIYAVDFHDNWSSGTSFNVTTPGNHANFAIPTPPARIGIRPTGAYWGSGGEQMDTLSGNLNWTLPLLKAQGRSGWGVGFSLNYNSQMWRQDSGGTWNLGFDVGYGFGWRLMAGAVVPYWSDPYTIDHYIYTDSTGADYSLNVNTNGIWTSTEGIYVSYDPAGPKLLFPDGTVWTMGCESGGSEPDIGVRYPTLMQDTNGNQVLIHYQTGQGASSGDTSARISSIEDVRSHPEYNHPYSYTFTYNADATPHLTGITNFVETAESYTFTYLANQSVSSPFGYDPNSAVTASLLQRATNSNAIDHTFEYSGGSGELTRAVLPYGGSLRWAYRNVTFSGGRTIREVQYRYLAKQSSAAEQTYMMWRDGNDINRDWHLAGSLFDPTGAIRNWVFYSATGSWWNGLLTGFTQQAYSGGPAMRSQDFTWAQDPAGNPYIGAAVTTLDPGSSYQKQSKTTQIVDAHGNLAQSSIYNFGTGTTAETTPSRTYTTGYLGGSQYTSRNIWNRPIWTTVTNGSQTVTVGGAAYDNYSCGGSGLTNVTGQRLHDANYYGVSFLYRGNPTSTSSLTESACLKYDITGAVTGTIGTRGTTSMVSSSTTNYAAPVAITANNYTTTLAYNGFLAVTSASGQNSETTGMSYTGGRPVQTTSPYGAVTSIGYSNNPPLTIATTNQHWVRSNLDGLGRPIRVESGDNSATKSIVDTEYDSCACSPLGKMKRTSQPYAPGGTVYWTTYTYDGLGRTLTTVAPDGATTTYLYQGNATTITDAAGKWKKYVTDAMGNLIQVIEPNPGNN